MTSDQACDVCREQRPAYLLLVTRHDVSHQFGLPCGALERVVQHCSDRDECLSAAAEPDNWAVLVETAAEAAVALPPMDPWEFGEID